MNFVTDFLKSKDYPLCAQTGVVNGSISAVNHCGGVQNVNK